MVGKPNLSTDAENKPGSKGAGMVSPGLSPLDQEREASMADEGGASGAVMETQDEIARPVETGERVEILQEMRYAAGLLAGATGLWIMKKIIGKDRAA